MFQPVESSHGNEDIKLEKSMKQYITKQEMWPSLGMENCSESITSGSVSCNYEYEWIVSFFGGKFCDLHEPPQIIMNFTLSRSMAWN